MCRPLKIVIPGKPDKQERPRAAYVKGHIVMYDAKDSKDAKKKIAEITSREIEAQKWTPPTDEALAIVITAYFPYLKSWTKKELARVKSGGLLPMSKPDIDNVAKIYLDGLVEGGAFRDDALVVEMHCYKFYAEEPCTVITVDRVKKSNG